MLCAEQNRLNCCCSSHIDNVSKPCNMTKSCSGGSQVEFEVLNSKRDPLYWGCMDHIDWGT